MTVLVIVLIVNVVVVLTVGDDVVTMVHTYTFNTCTNTHKVTCDMTTPTHGKMRTYQ